jgi:hypothetical protein
MDFRTLIPADAKWTPFDLRHEAAQLRADRLNAQTERMIWKAIAKGVGNRVWRSNPISDEDGFVVRYQFAILGPDENAPGAGVVFGPFSER